MMVSAVCAVAGAPSPMMTAAPAAAIHLPRFTLSSLCVPRSLRYRFRRHSAELGFHLAPELYGEIVAVDFDVAPGKRRASRDVALELDVLRQAEGQQTLRQRALGRRLPAPHAEPALAVKNLAGFQIALGGGDHVGAKFFWRAGRLAAQGGGRHRDAEFQADQMDRAIERGVSAAAV